jgi:tetratricopeptide (TPR) repeat protein
MSSTQVKPRREIFIGRQIELQQFEAALGRRGLLGWLLGPGVKPCVFLPHGIGGIGKTWLAQECLKRARNPGWATVEVDWDKADQRPSERLDLMNITAERLKEKYGEKAVREYLDARGRARQVRNRVSRYKQENREKWQGLVDATQALAEAGVGLLRSEKAGKAAGAAVQVTGKVVNAGAAAMAQAEDSFLDWLVESKKLKQDDVLLYKDPDHRLADRLVDALVSVVRRQPLVVLVDSCEALSLRLEEWLRDAIVCPAVKRGAPLLFIVAGRFNQYQERQVEDSGGIRRSVKGYADRLTDPPPVSWDITRFADPEVAQYLEANELEPTEDLVALVQELARGVPFAVELVTQALLKLGTERVREDFPPKDPALLSAQEMVTLVVRRFLRYCLDEVDEARVQALAVLHTPDEGVLRAVWGLADEESPRATLRNLEARYGFVQINGWLHPVVRDFIRDDLRGNERKMERRLGKAAADYYLPLWEKATTDVPRLDERVADARWRKATLNTLNALCWGDEAAVLPFAAAWVIEAMQFDWGFARVLLKLAREFRRPPDWWPGRHHRILDVLKQVVEGEDKEEWIGLEALLREADALDLAESHRCILHLWRASNLYRQGRFQDALQACLDATQVLPDDRSLAEALAKWFDRVGWKLGWERGTAIPSSDAETALCKAVALQEDAGYHWVGLGVMKYGLKKLEGAVEALEKGIQLEGEKANSLTWLGNVYGTLGRHQEAIAEFQRAIELDPQKGAPYNGLGNIYLALGRYEEAIAEYQRAIELDPQVAIPHDNLGNVYRNLDRHEEAMAEFQQAIELDPRYADPHHGLGNVYRDLGRHEEAEAAYQQAIELDPKLAAPHHGLGDVYLDLGRHEEAVAEFQRAIELDPRNAASQASFAAACRKLGREAEYAEHIRLARELMANVSEYNKACIEAIAGNADKALGWLARVLEKAPGMRDLARRDPDFEELRKDPRFWEVVGKLSADSGTD